MLNKLRLPTLAVAAALALGPTTAMARDRDDIRHQRHEERERTRRFLNRDYWWGNGPYVYRPAPYRGGWYDRWGVWHPYY